MKEKIESPLCVRTDGHRLIITVGINRLEGNEAHPTIPELQIKSPTMWVRDIITELEREDEQGASLLTDLFDKAIQNALDNGSFAINEKAYDRAMKLRMPNAAGEVRRNAVPPTALFGELVLMVDVFAACIETGIVPTHGSPCHRKARQLVDKSGMKPKRNRRRLPPNKGISLI